eukprot:2531203-Pleurochrysis_carterae.AAC.1
MIGVPTPTIDAMIEWNQKLIGKEYLTPDGKINGKDAGRRTPRTRALAHARTHWHSRTHARTGTRACTHALALAHALAHAHACPRKPRTPSHA